MRSLYTIGINWMIFGFQIASFFNKKAKLGMQGRKNLITDLKLKIPKEKPLYWMHCSSLGEYEQGLPLWDAMKNEYPDACFVVSFFSPSGMEVAKHNSKDILFYLPFDTPKKMSDLIHVLNPEKVFFIKYEYWYNLLNELQKREIPHYFISSIFNENKVFFKNYGNWFLKHLQRTTYFFVQNKESKEILNKHDINNVSIAGDTRFERVKDILKKDNTLGWMANFKKDSMLLVAGSTWKKDEELLVDYINNKLSNNVKVLIAPHEIKLEKIIQLKSKLSKKVVLYSEIQELDAHGKLEEFQVLVLDTIGLLTKVYSYANISYVGGGFGKAGIHNVLEPAVFGVPVIFGPIYHQFLEAEELLGLEGATSITSQEQLNNILNELLKDLDKRKKMGQNAQNYILDKPNSVHVILEKIN